VLPKAPKCCYTILFNTKYAIHYRIKMFTVKNYFKGVANHVDRRA
jgi:hypothetical protein